MLKNFFTVAFRNLFRNKSYTFINITGLALGILCFLLMLIYVRYEFSYDQFHEKEIYRLYSQRPYDDTDYAITGGAHANVLHQEFTNFENIARLNWTTVNVSYHDSTKRIRRDEPNFCFADSTFLEVFDYQLLEGNASHILAHANGMIITERMAKEYFGDENPMGKMLNLSGRIDLQVQGVMENLPENTHQEIDFLASLTALKKFYNFRNLNREFSSYWWPRMYTYVTLNNEKDVSQLNEQLPEVFAEYVDEDLKNEFFPTLQPISDIHLFSNTRPSEMKEPGKISYIYLFAGISFLILFIACINFTNLSVARSTRRAKEVGIRKAVGARKKHLTFQFMGEAALLSLIALGVGVLLAELALPYFNELTQRSLGMNYQPGSAFWLFAGSVFVLTTLMAGIYPSLVIAGFNVTKALKGISGSGKPRGNALQRGLVVFQFAASTTLIIGTFIAWYQLNYMRNADLGFDKEQIICIETPAMQTQGVININQTREKSKKLRNVERAYSQLSPVKVVSRTSLRPGMSRGPQYKYLLRGDEPDYADAPYIYRQAVGYNYFNLIGVEIISGRNFTASSGADADQSIIVNESAVKELGFTNSSILGLEIQSFINERNNLYGERNGKVIGVVKDYHAGSFRTEIAPTIYMTNEDVFTARTSHLLVKTTPQTNIPQLVENLEQEWKAVFPSLPFAYSFLDNDLNLRYRAEERFVKIILTVSALAIFIACLGLFGLASYMTERRIKEIGIRKVLGASIGQLVVLLNKSYFLLIAVAFALAVPVAWYAMSQWLQNFVYRISINPLFFVIAGGVSVLIAAFTVTYQSVKAARTNPAYTLKDE